MDQPGVAIQAGSMNTGTGVPKPTGMARLGLGGSHIASLSTRPGRAEIDTLLDDAYAGGVRFFDTADIYGQGDSERRLSRLSDKDDVIFCTKAGLALGVSQSFVRVLKPVLRPVLLRLKRGGAAAASMRQTTQSTEFGADHLRRQLSGSLQRLRRNPVDLFLLHSPQQRDMEDGRLLDLLSSFKTEGLAQRVGVSCPDLEVAKALVGSGQVDALQIPMDATQLEEAEPVLARAGQDGVWIIAREVLPAEVRQSLGIEAGLAPLARDPRITVVLVGTTSRVHLQQNMAAFRAALDRAG